jgi:hypothetical protein
MRHSGDGGLSSSPSDFVALRRIGNGFFVAAADY